MVSALITASGAGNWALPPDCASGTVITTECWGAGAGSSSGASFGAGGAGGAYAKDTYTVLPADIVAGSIPYVVGAGGAGSIASAPAGGLDTSFGLRTNHHTNSTFQGSTGSTLGTGWGFTLVGLTAACTFGVDTSLGPSLDYADINFSGTSSGTSLHIDVACTSLPAAGVAETASMYLALKASTTGWASVSAIALNENYNTWWAYQATPASTAITPGSMNSTLVQYTNTATAVNLATAHSVQSSIIFTIATATAYNFTIRFAGFQHQSGTSAVTYQSTPGTYTCAFGGSPPNGVTGGTAAHFGTGNTGVGRTLYRLGGAGAAYNAAGSGGGGSAGFDGTGAVGTTAGVGGRGDGSTGGTGGAVKTTTPGNPGTSNTEGGGGGGACTQASSTPVGGAGGAPGGAGGSATLAAGTGGTGAAGQIRLTYTPSIQITKSSILQPFLAQ